MKRKPRRVRCIECDGLYHPRRMYPTREGPVHDECHEDRIRRGEKPKNRPNKIRDEDE